MQCCQILQTNVPIIQSYAVYTLLNVNCCYYGHKLRFFTAQKVLKFIAEISLLTFLIRTTEQAFLVCDTQKWLISFNVISVLIKFTF